MESLRQRQTSRMAGRDLEGDQQHDKERSMAQGKEGPDSKQLPLDWQQMVFQETRKKESTARVCVGWDTSKFPGLTTLNILHQ